MLPHWPPEQNGWPGTSAQSLLQPPQVASSVRSVSQPSPSTPLQSPYADEAQSSIRQVPVAQVATALSRAQARLHSPQCVRLSSDVSQPVWASPSQSP